MKPSKLKLIGLSTLLTAILLVSPAAAAKNVPPGVSGENQYTETLPGPGGNHPTGGGGSNGGSPAEVLGASNARKLEALGPEGQAAAQLAAETALTAGGGSPNGKQGASKGSIAAGSNGRGSSGSGSSGFEQVVKQITGTGGSNSGGMSWLLPLLIGGSIVIAAAYLIGRRRPTRPQD
ncbi:MAG TPA: hypothetical protein VMH33_06960 [Solirubrobacterales bacterium]|nr:hypothetical protein [Solirubrobacterales bacterium]